MAVRLTADMPDDVGTESGWIMRWRAIDPTTGNDVSGVVVSNVNVDGDTGSSMTGGTTTETLGPWFLVPGPGA